MTFEEALQFQSSDEEVVLGIVPEVASSNGLPPHLLRIQEYLIKVILISFAFSQVIDTELLSPIDLIIGSFNVFVKILITLLHVF